MKNFTPDVKAKGFIFTAWHCVRKLCCLKIVNNEALKYHDNS